MQLLVLEEEVRLDRVDAAATIAIVARVDGLSVVEGGEDF